MKEDTLWKLKLEKDWPTCLKHIAQENFVCKVHYTGRTKRNNRDICEQQHAKMVTRKKWMKMWNTWRFRVMNHCIQKHRKYNTEIVKTTTVESETTKMLTMSKVMRKCLQLFKYNETAAMTILMNRHFNSIKWRDLILINGYWNLSQSAVCERSVFSCFLKCQSQHQYLLCC